MSTAAKTYTRVADYLHSIYEPDCDLVDGELQERNAGEIKHGLLTMAIGIWFGQHFDDWSLVSLADVRVQVKQDRYRVADVAVIPANYSDENVLISAPVIVIEILSPEARISRYKERLDDYREMGIRNIWVIDPMKWEAHDCSSESWIPTRRLEVPGTPIYLALDELAVQETRR